MRLIIFPLAFLLSIAILPGCKNNPDKSPLVNNPEQALTDSLKDGEQSVYYENGNLHYIVEYKKGKANGRVREYTPDGKIYMDAIYSDGHRDGKCTHFYKNGIPFSVSNFVNGEKDGIESKYYDDGKLLATIIYKKNKVQPGLREYKKDGTEIKQENDLVIKEIDHSASEGKYFFQVSLLKPQANVTFYASPQSDPESREKLQLSGNTGILEIPVSSRHFVMKNLIFQAEYKTHLGNTMRLEKLYHHPVQR